MSPTENLTRLLDEIANGDHELDPSTRAAILERLAKTPAIADQFARWNADDAVQALAIEVAA